MDKKEILSLNKQGKADLHIHSCLSPCASLDMSPRNIAKYGKENGFDVVALTDHSSAKNCPAFKYECEKQGVTPLFGMELTTKEELHVLCITDDLAKAMLFDKVVEEKILKIPNDLTVFGEQPVVNEKEEVIMQVPYYLGAAVDMSVDDIWDFIDVTEWLIIPSHINRKKYSLISQLGFVPDLPFDAIEISKNINGLQVPDDVLNKYQVVYNSDRHFME